MSDSPDKPYPMGINISIHPRSETTVVVERSNGHRWLKIQNDLSGAEATEVIIFLNYGIAGKICDALRLEAVSESIDI